MFAAVNAVQWCHYANFTLTDIAISQSYFLNSSHLHLSQSLFQSTLFQATCLCEMQCASFTAISMSPLVYTRLQTTFSLQHAFGPTRNVYCHSQKNAPWMISLWSEVTWSYNGGISGEMVNSASLNQVRKFGSLRVKLFEIYDVSQPMGIFRAYSPEHFPWQVSAFDSHRYFLHQTRNKPHWYC